MQDIENHLLTGKDAGNYHIDRLLGKGPLSHFYKAHSVTGQRVMLTAFPLLEGSHERGQGLTNAARTQAGTALTQLKHPAIIPIYAYGECDGYPYLVTPFVPGRSLAQIVQSQGPFSVESVLPVLRQVADGLDYAHRNGILHGSLSAANIVQGDESTVQIAGFGFMHILAQHYLGQDGGSDAQPLYTAALFAGSPARMAPEIVATAMGQPVRFDARVDIYAMGILLFELVTGHLPFTGITPLEIAQQQDQQSIPSLATLYGESRPSLANVDVVLQKALAHHPEQRFQSAGELMQALGQALNSPSAPTNEVASLAHNNPDAEPIINGRREREDAEPIINGRRERGPYAAFGGEVSNSSEAPQQGEASDFDPFVWWANVSPTQTVAHPKVTRTALKTVQKHKQDRRKVVALLTAGSVVAIVGLGGGTIALAHVLHPSPQQAQTASTPPQLPAPTIQPTPTAQPAPTPAPTAQPQKPTATAQPQSPTATTNAAPTPTPQPPPPTPQPPTPTPQPQHTGTVIGSTSMPGNTAQGFTNPQNGNGSLLIHLPNGNFVAYNRSCTHAGVPVNYDPGSHHLLCPAHGAVFDPANNAHPIQGPNNGPLAMVAIHVNGDGTITVG